MKNKHDIIWLDTVDSTNSEAKRRILKIDNLSVVSALEQTSGRGQLGNVWTSKAGENLTFSIVLKFADQNIWLNVHDQSVINELTSLSVVDFLGTHGIEAKIKWPNDIYVGNKKICGILIENSLSGSHINHSVIGIGLNINQRNFDVNLLNPISMTQLTGNSYDISECLEELISIFKKYIQRYLHGNGGYAKLRKLYLGQLWRLNETSRFTTVDKEGNVYEFTGAIRNLSYIGNLIVETEEGELKEFAFKEIGYIL